MATPLELLFDLTSVIAFGLSAAQLADLLADGHVGAAVAGFAFSTFGVSWAWINFSWFASAYDTDDWLYRLTTMLQMIGVIVLALGIPPIYSSIAAGEHVDNRIAVAGYVVMRLAMVAQWLRAAAADPARRRTCVTYAVTITVAQIGWIAAIFVHTSVPVTFTVYAVLVALVEFAGPWYAERCRGMTPWHPGITSPSVTACWSSSRWARVWSAPSPRCRRWSVNTAGPWMPRWSVAWPADKTFSGCGGPTSSFRPPRSARAPGAGVRIRLRAYRDLRGDRGDRRRPAHRGHLSGGVIPG